jgi:cysteine desulfurase
MKLPIYMDHHATTPVDQRVLEVMLPYFTEVYGNAASIDHEYGYQAKQAVDRSREQIAAVINAQPEEIVFTSGATEADNLAILGAADQYVAKGKHIITCVTEHKAVLDTCHYLELKGWKVSYLPVDSNGLVSPDEVRQAITPETVLVSIMAANNEIGVLAPLAEIGRLTHEHEIIFHTDATQAVGYVPIDVQMMNIDLLSMSGHKVYGPKGIGALYVRNRRPRIKLAEQMHGGGHERGMRSGTLNVPGIVGMGAALDLAKREMKGEYDRLKVLRDYLWEGLRMELPVIKLNGHPVQRLPHNLSVAITGVESRSLLVQLKYDVALSVGSACTTAKVEPSHVIAALGFGDERAYSSIRFGLGRSNNQEEIDYVLQQTLDAVNRLKRM